MIRRCAASDTGRSPRRSRLVATMSRWPPAGRPAGPPARRRGVPVAVRSLQGHGLPAARGKPRQAGPGLASAAWAAWQPEGNEQQQPPRTPGPGADWSKTRRVLNVPSLVLLGGYPTWPEPVSSSKQLNDKPLEPPAHYPASVRRRWRPFNTAANAPTT